jgi:hypothetical protein
MSRAAPLIGILFLTVIVSIVVIIWEWTRPSAATVTNLVGSCEDAATNLIDMSVATCCCLNGRATGNLFYPPDSWVIAPTPAPYISVCSSYCTTYDENGCHGNVDQFNSCVSRLKPNNCNSPAMPVGRIGSTFYYVTSIGEGVCPIHSSAPPCTTC